MARRVWTREETLMAFTLYYLLPAKEIDKKGADINALAAAIGRTPGSVALKAWNIAAYDTNRLVAGRVGMKRGSKLESLIWEELAERGDALIEEGVSLLAETLASSSVSAVISFAVVDVQCAGENRVVERAERINQQYFRNSLLRNYEEKCCLTRLAVPQLLVASHIKPWAASDPKTERLAASNGLLLNALHDKAFDQGLITVDKQLRVIVSSKLGRDDVTTRWIRCFEGKRIREPLTSPPAQEFIEYHNGMVFVA